MVRGFGFGTGAWGRDGACGEVGHGDVPPRPVAFRRRAAARGEAGQMAVELAVLLPIVIVMVLTVYNLMRFVELSALFDRVAADAVISQGVAPAGTQSEWAAAAKVRSCIEEALGSSSVDVLVTTQSACSSTPHDARVIFPLSPLLTRYTCTLRYRPWPGSVYLGGAVYRSPFVLTHDCTLVVDRYRPGVVV